MELDSKEGVQALVVNMVRARESRQPQMEDALIGIKNKYLHKYCVGTKVFKITVLTQSTLNFLVWKSFLPNFPKDIFFLKWKSGH